MPIFALFYVILAPWLGAFADARPKRNVMFFSNAIKVVGCLMMLFGSHPLMAYAVVGLGAAAYSPAKYGILTELLPASQLVKANGWIEGLTIASIILGILLGGQLVAMRSPAAAGDRHAVFPTGIDTPPEAAIFVLIFIYTLAAWFNLRISADRRRDAAHAEEPAGAGARFLDLQLAAVARQAGADLPCDHTLFWGVSGNLRYIILAWSAAALGYSTTQASSLAGSWPSAPRWAHHGSVRMRLDMATQVIPMGIIMGVLIIVMKFIINVWVAAPS